MRSKTDFRKSILLVLVSSCVPIELDGPAASLFAHGKCFSAGSIMGPVGIQAI